MVRLQICTPMICCKWTPTTSSVALFSAPSSSETCRSTPVRSSVALSSALSSSMSYRSTSSSSAAPSLPPSSLPPTGAELLGLVSGKEHARPPRSVGLRQGRAACEPRFFVLSLSPNPFFLVGGGCYWQTCLLSSKTPASSSSSRLFHSRLAAMDYARFLRSVRRQFIDEPNKYGEFLEIFHEFKRGSFGKEDLRSQVTVLFNRLPGITQGFNELVQVAYI